MSPPYAVDRDFWQLMDRSGKCWVWTGPVFATGEAESCSLLPTPLGSRRPRQPRAGPRSSEWQAGSSSGVGAAHNPNADSEGQSGRAEHEQVARRVEDACDADGAGLAVWSGERSDTRAQLAALERAVGPAGYRFNSGPSGSFGVADGLPSGLARACISAYGDAFLPQIAEAIGNAIRRTDEALSAAA